MPTTIDRFGAAAALPYYWQIRNNPTFWFRKKNRWTIPAGFHHRNRRSSRMIAVGARRSAWPSAPSSHNAIVLGTMVLEVKSIAL
jgi:hypothetical protein